VSDSILGLLVRIAGADAVRREPGGMARVTPTTSDAVAGILGVAHDEGWRVAIEGNGTWRAEDAPADVILSLRGLDEPGQIDPGAARVLVGAGVALERLRLQVLESAAWLPLDPPGRPDRSIGSVVVTATDGPLRSGFGGVADQLLAVSVATGDGRTLRIDRGSDPDLLSLHAGSFGALGIITSIELLLRALPQADETWVAVGPRDPLTAAGQELRLQEAPVAAAELFSPALATESEWLLAVRLLGDPDEVDAARQKLPELPVTWEQLAPVRRTNLWNGAARAVTTVPVSIRLGVLPESLDETIDLVVNRLGEGMLSAGATVGGLRWSGVADTESLRTLQGELALREIPLTIERAPWRVRRTLGHYGAYRERNAREVSRRRPEFDPAGILVSALDAGQEP